MGNKIKRLAEARQKKDWTQKEIEAFAKRRAKELKRISEETEEPDDLASGTQTPAEDKDNDDE